MGYPKSVSISLPPKLGREILRRAKRRNQTTSEFVRAAVAQYIEDQESRKALWRKSLEYGRKKAKELGLKSEKEIQRIVDEYRRGNSTPYARSRRR